MNKKIILTAALMTTFVSGAFAAGMVYDPAEFDYSPKTANVSASTPSVTTVTVSDKIQEARSSASTAAETKTEPVRTTVSEVKEAPKSMATPATDSPSGTNYNNALFELDSAQVTLRNDLLDLKAKYQEVDTQYILIKEKRKNLANEIKTVEKKIKNLESSKNNIRKTML